MRFLSLWFLLVIAFTEGLEFTVEETAQWESYKTEYAKSYYTQEEELERKQIFLNNLEFVRDHNKKFDKGEETFDVAINNFADMTNEEFVQKMLTLQQPEVAPAGAAELFQNTERVEDLPSTVDWRDEGAVTPIKNQGDCGSCWAFSAVGSLEGQHFLSTGELVSLSEQNLVDCAMVPANRSGCDGGWMVTAFQYIINNTGIDTEASYPYQSKTGMEGACRFNASNVGATMTGYVNITEGSEADLQAAVATVGPISVAIDAGHLSFQLYRSGVYKKWLCQKKHLNHGVLVVGYGTKSGKWLWDGDYWLVKNSWGTSWGMDGYIMMARNHNNMCGIATFASYPLV